MIRALAVCAALVLASAAGSAAELTLPAGARPLSERVTELGSYALPIGPFGNGAVPVRGFEGRIERRTWRIDGAVATTLQLLAPLRAQIEAAGFEVVFQCEDRACGGFDFRFGTEVVPTPDMHVDVRNYRFLAAQREDAEAISLLVSRSRDAAYLQVIRVLPADGAPPASARPDPGAEPARPDPSTTGARPESDPLEALMRQGHIVLDDLDFALGAEALGPGPYPSLTRLADLLQERPGLRIALVGHTDSSGTLAVNIALSKRRAAAVRARLISEYGIDPARIEAEGMGYLAPVASNLTEAGRQANRRVEAILLSEP